MSGKPLDLSIINRMIRPYHLTMKSRLLPILILLLPAFLVYINSLGNGFVWDDKVIILNNPLLKGLQDIPALLSSEDATSPRHMTGYYRPLTYLTFLFERILWGANPFGAHLINLLLHLGVSISLYYLISLIFKNDLLAFLSALIFSLHPVNSETVNFLSGGRNTLLSALFMLISFILYIRQRRLLSVLSFCLSLFSKEFGLLLPLFLILYDKIPAPEKKSFKAYLPYFIALIIYLAIRGMVVGGTGVDLDLTHLPNRIMLVPEIFVRYLTMLFIPLRLNIFHIVESPEVFDLGVAFYTAGFLFVVISVLLLRKSKVIFFSSSLILLSLLPVTNVIPLAHTLMAERHAYLSSMWFGLFLSYLLLRMRSNPDEPAKGRHSREGGNPLSSDFFKKMDSRLGTSGMTAFKFFIVFILCVVYSAVVINRNPVWENEHGLWTDAIDKSPDAFEAHYNLGVLMDTEGRIDEAIEQYLIAARLKPDNAFVHDNLGIAYDRKGWKDWAMGQYRLAISLKPDCANAHYNLGMAYKEKGLTDKAIEHLQFAAAFSSDDPVSVYFNLGRAYGEKGLWDKAVEALEAAAGLNPSSPSLRKYLAQAYERKAAADKKARITDGKKWQGEGNK